MSNELATSALLIAGGGFFAVHCSRAAVREYRAGEGRSRFGSYTRADEPLKFWGTISGTALAGLFGLFSFCFGVASAATLGWHN